jgi:hypothetical protein
VEGHHPEGRDQAGIGALTSDVWKFVALKLGYCVEYCVEHIVRIGRVGRASNGDITVSLWSLNKGERSLLPQT